MRLLFVYGTVENAGSAQDIYNYCEAAKRMGHEAALYAPEGAVSRFDCSPDLESADGVIFPLEWNIYLHNNEPLDLEEPMRRVPRRRRVVIDCDGMYNDVTRVDGDYNHPDEAGRRTRTELYDAIPCMSKAVFNPVLIRPLFSRLGLVTCRTFETPAANTIPLFAQDPSYVEEIYGPEAIELVLPEDKPNAKILDILEQPDRYAGIVQGIRDDHAGKHS